MQSVACLKYHAVFYFWKFTKRVYLKKKKKEKPLCTFHISCFEQICIFQIQMECIFSSGFMWKRLSLEQSLPECGFVDQALFHDVSFTYSSWVPLLSSWWHRPATKVCHMSWCVDWHCLSHSRVSAWFGPRLVLCWGCAVLHTNKRIIPER